MARTTPAQKPRGAHRRMSRGGLPGALMTRGCAESRRGLSSPARAGRGSGDGLGGADGPAGSAFGSAAGFWTGLRPRLCSGRSTRIRRPADVRSPDPQVLHALPRRHPAARPRRGRGPPCSDARLGGPRRCAPDRAHVPVQGLRRGVRFREPGRRPVRDRGPPSGRRLRLGLRDRLAPDQEDQGPARERLHPGGEDRSAGRRDVSGPADVALVAPAAERNREPIRAVLARVLPASGLVLEIASGTGQHAVHMAGALPRLVWQPIDPDPQMRASIRAWTARFGLANVRAPLDLDVRAPCWPLAAADAVVCINLIHIAPWSATAALAAGAARLLPPAGVLVLYGPFRREGRHTAPSNAAFDRSLRAADPDWGVRDLESAADVASAAGLALEEVVAMPANNLSVVFRRAPGG